MNVEELATQLTPHFDGRYAKLADVGAVADKLDRIEKLPMKAVRWIAGVVVAAGLTNMVTTYLTHQESAPKVEQAAASAQQAAASQTVVIKKLDSIQSAQQAASNAAGP